MAKPLSIMGHNGTTSPDGLAEIPDILVARVAHFLTSDLRNRLPIDISDSESIEVCSIVLDYLKNEYGKVTEHARLGLAYAKMVRRLRDTLDL